MSEDNQYVIYEKVGEKYISRPVTFKEGLQIRYGKGAGTLFFWSVQAFVLMMFFSCISAKDLEGGWILAICLLLGFFNNFVRPYKSNKKNSNNK